jgi:hypothetical protein
VSKGKFYSTLVLNLLLYLGADSAASPTAEYILQPLRARDGASAAHLLL